MFPHESFHIHLYGITEAQNSPEPTQELAGASGAVQPAPLQSSFEDAQTRLENHLPAVLLEPDGSLAWAGPDHQIVGMIYDAGDLIQYVELRGQAGKRQLEELVQTLSGCQNCDEFAVMILPGRQWKNFQSFAMSLQ